MNLSEYPSPLTQFVIKGNHDQYTVRLPEKERFRLNHIFNNHEYEIPPHLRPDGAMTVVCFIMTPSPL